jgi:superfamily II DNA or RNA helicase
MAFVAVQQGPAQYATLQYPEPYLPKNFKFAHDLVQQLVKLDRTALRWGGSVAIPPTLQADYPAVFTALREGLTLDNGFTLFHDDDQGWWHVPHMLGRYLFGPRPPHLPHPPWQPLPPERRIFTGQLLTQNPPQVQLCTAWLQHVRLTGAGQISSSCGSGKSIMLVYSIVQLGWRAVIVATQLTFLTQLQRKAFTDFAPHLRVAILRGKNYKKVKDADVVLVTPKTLAQVGHDPTFWATFGTLATDETHLLAIKDMLKGMANVQPQYTLSATATLARNDDNFPVLPAMFGECAVVLDRVWDYIFVHRTVLRYTAHDDKKLPLETIRYGPMQGRPNCLLYHDTLTLCTARSMVILHQLALDLSTRAKIMVLCHRIEHILRLRELWQTHFGRTAGVLYNETNKGAAQLENLDNQVIISTYGSGGTALDEDMIDTIYLVTPMSKASKTMMVQILGRCRPKAGKRVPLVRDFVDDCVLGWSMWKKRWAALAIFHPQLSQTNQVITDRVNLATIKMEYKQLRAADDSDLDL